MEDISQNPKLKAPEPNTKSTLGHYFKSITEFPEFFQAQNGILKKNKSQNGARQSNPGIRKATARECLKHTDLYQNEQLAYEGLIEGKGTLDKRLSMNHIFPKGPMYKTWQVYEEIMRTPQDSNEKLLLEEAAEAVILVLFEDSPDVAQKGLSELKVIETENSTLEDRARSLNWILYITLLAPKNLRLGGKDLGAIIADHLDPWYSTDKTERMISSKISKSFNSLRTLLGLDIIESKKDANGLEMSSTFFF